MGDRLINRAERLRRIERLLFAHPNGMRTVEIAHAMGVDRRTIYRDMEALSRSGVPLWQEAGRFGIARDRYQATVRLGVHEALMLFLTTRMFAARVSAYNALLAASLARLAGAFPEPLAAQVQASADAIGQHVADGDASVILEVIAGAWANLRQVRLWYRGRQHDVSIYCLAPTGVDEVYVIGRDEETGHVGAFRLGSVERAQLLDERYTLPAELDAGCHRFQPWHPAPGDPSIEVVLQFTPAATPVIRARLWYPSQTIEELEGGVCRLTLRVTDLREIRAWLLSWGAEVQVLAPPVLRAEIASEARRLANLYV